jgi:hypothetical protein
MKNWLIVSLASFAVAMLVCVLPSAAQTNYMSLGSVSAPTTIACPANRGFAGTACSSTTITGCPNDQDFPLVYSVNAPTNGQQPKGTIVLLSGFGGGNAVLPDGEEDLYVPTYTAAGYQVVQIAWGTPSGAIDWEFSNINTPSLGYNIRNAACRPATFLRYVYDHIYTNPTGKAGMCAQGFSAGSGAIAYSMAWYGAADQNTGYLDKVELLSGPELADIERGCEIGSGGASMQFASVCLGNQPWLPRMVSAKRTASARL